MTWNYRVVRTTDGEEESFAIYESLLRWRRPPRGPHGGPGASVGRDPGGAGRGSHLLPGSAEPAHAG